MAKAKKKVAKKLSKASLSGEWRSTTGATIGFSIKPSGKDMAVRLAFPSKNVILSERAWRAFFKFLNSTFATVRPMTMSEELKAFYQAKRDAWRKKRQRRMRRRFFGPTVVKTNHSKRKPKAPPAVDLTTPFEPDASLVEVAKEALKR